MASSYHPLDTRSVPFYGARMKPPDVTDQTTEKIRAAYRGGRSAAFWYVWNNWDAITGGGTGRIRPAWSKVATVLNEVGFRGYDRKLKQPIPYNAETVRKLFDRVRELRAVRADIEGYVRKVPAETPEADAILAKFRESLKGNQ
jgi:hypothetical protein